MGRMHSAGKGMSKSARPYKRTPPSWLKVSSADVEDHICKFAKKGLTPSQIGVILRDSHGIAQVKSVTGSKVLRLLKKNGASLSMELPCRALFGVHSVHRYADVLLFFCFVCSARAPVLNFHWGLITPPTRHATCRRALPPYSVLPDVRI